MRRNILTISILLALGTLTFGSSVAQPDSGCGLPTVFVRKAAGWNEVNVLRGKGAIPNVRGALLFAVEVIFNERCSEPDLNRIQIEQLELGVKTTIPVSRWENVYVVLDTARNFRADAGEKRYPAEFQSKMPDDKLVVRNLDVRARYDIPEVFLFFADLKDVQDKDTISVELGYSRNTILRPVEKDVEISVVVGQTTFTHYRGNRAPELYYLSAQPFSNRETVFPRSGSPQEQFEFSIQYLDEDGDRPSVAEVWIDENGNGEWEKNERHPMTDQKPDLTFREPHIFTFKKNFAGSKLKELRFKFRFADEEMPAVFKGARYQQGQTPEFEKVFELAFEHNVAIEVGGLRPEGYLPGETMSLKIRAFVYYQAAIELDWNGFAKKFAPGQFRFVGLRTGERVIYNDRYDLEEATVFFQAPSTCEEKNHYVSFPSLAFSAKVDGRRGEIPLRKMEAKTTLKSRLTGPFVSKTSLGVGEPIVYRLRHERACAAVRPAELDALTFKPFVVVEKDVRTVTNVPFVAEELEWVLMIFEPKGEYQIPAFKFPFGALGGSTVTVYPTTGAFPGKKIELPYQEKRIRPVPPPPFSRLVPLLLALGAGAIVLTLVRPVRAVARRVIKRRRTAPWQQKVISAHRHMREVLAGAASSLEEQELFALYHAIRGYLLAIENAGDTNSSSDARTLQRSLAGSVDAGLLNDFMAFEDLLMQQPRNSEQIRQVMVRLDQSSLAMYDQLN